jgi:hypothetical protein
MTNYFNSLCNPAKLYAALIALTLLLSLFNGVPTMIIVTKLIFALLWTLILNCVCSSGFTWFSWLLVLLPFVLFILGVLGLMRMAQSQQLMQSMQFQ